LFEAGLDQQGRTQGELMGRRFRPGVFYCINNCLWEIEATLDLDGFGTGNAKNSTNTATSSILQRGVVNFHGEKLNPFLPTVQFGMDVSTSIGVARQGSSSVGTQAEYDLLTRNTFDDGRAGQGMVLNWDDRPLDAIGIPGRINRFQVAMASVQNGDFPDRIGHHPGIDSFRHALRTHERFMRNRGALQHDQWRAISPESYFAARMGSFLFSLSAHEHRPKYPLVRCE